MNKYTIRNLDSAEIDTLVELITLAIIDIGHPLLGETTGEKAEKEFLAQLKEKVDVC